MGKIYEITLAEHTISYSFHYPETKRKFITFLRKSSSDHADIKVEEERLRIAREMIEKEYSDGYVEFKTLIGLTSRKLLTYNACIFHSVSFIFRGYAWLLTAPSGVGKTTQFKNWNSIFPGEITMISGDMPVISLQRDRLINIYPSPWNGKERLGSNLMAPLGGIVYLKQASENKLSKACISEILIPIMEQFIVSPDTEEEIYNLVDLADTLLRCYPVWEMKNNGNTESTKLLREIIINRIKEIGE